MNYNKFDSPGKWIQCLTVVAAILFIGNCASAQQYSNDVQWLIDALDITKGSVVADIGAGDGDQSIALAQLVGSEGHIYSTELGADELQNLQRTIESSELSNITVLEGHPEKTNLPEECCEAIFLRRVYHHIGNPTAFNSSLLESLKPGGRLAIIDFKPRGEEAEPGERASGDQHGVTPETVIQELTDSGFRLVETKDESDRFYYILFSKME